MSAGLKMVALLIAGVLCLPAAALADTQTAHHARKAKKPPLPPPLPSGTQGPVPQIPLDAIPAVAPQVSYQDGMLTIIAPNSTLGDILRSVKKHTSADIDIPANASERVATHLGPGPAREIVAELLNGSHFNYVLLGSVENADSLVRVVLVPKSGPEPPATPAQAGDPTPAPVAANATPDAPEADVAEETPDETPDQNAAEADQQQVVPPEPPGVKTPQQLLQEMQQRQIQSQQQQQPQPGYQPPAPGVPIGPRPQAPQPPDQE